MEQKEQEILNKILFLRKRFRDDNMKEIYENGNKSIIEVHEKNILKKNSKTNENRNSNERSKSLISHIDSNDEKTYKSLLSTNYLKSKLSGNDCNTKLNLDDFGLSSGRKIFTNERPNMKEVTSNFGSEKEKNLCNLSLNEDSSNNNLNNNPNGSISNVNPQKQNIFISSSAKNLDQNKQRNAGGSNIDKNSSVNSSESNTISKNKKTKANLNENTGVLLDLEINNRGVIFNTINNEIHKHTNDVMSKIKSSNNNNSTNTNSIGNSNNNITNVINSGNNNNINSVNNSNVKKQDNNKTKSSNNDIFIDTILINNLNKHGDKKSSAKNKSEKNPISSLKVPNILTENKDSNSEINKKPSDAIPIQSHFHVEKPKENESVEPSSHLFEESRGNNKDTLSPFVQENAGNEKEEEDYEIDGNKGSYIDQDIFGFNSDDELFKIPAIDKKDTDDFFNENHFEDKNENQNNSNTIANPGNSNVSNLKMDSNKNKNFDDKANNNNINHLINSKDCKSGKDKNVTNSNGPKHNLENESKKPDLEIANLRNNSNNAIINEKSFLGNNIDKICKNEEFKNNNSPKFRNRNDDDTQINKNTDFNYKRKDLDRNLEQNKKMNPNLNNNDTLINKNKILPYEKQIAKIENSLTKPQAQLKEKNTNSMNDHEKNALKEFKKEFKEDKILNQNCNQQTNNSNDYLNWFEKGEKRNFIESKNREQSAYPDKKKDEINKQTAEKIKDLNSEKYQKDTIIDTSVRDFSMDDNDEFDNLFNDDNKRESNFESNVKDNKNLLQENYSIINVNDKDQNSKHNELLEIKPKNSMKIKLNFDLNTVELNSKFVEINQDVQMNDYDEEDEPNYFDENEEEKIDENYENEEDNQGENMELEENYSELYDEENDHNCMNREKSTIITIPNLKFLSEQNYEENDKPRIENEYNSSDKLKNDNVSNMERASKISNTNDNLKDGNLNMKKRVSKIIEDDDESDKQHENQNPSTKKSSTNKNPKEKNNCEIVEYSRKILDRANSENNIRTNKNSNLDNATTEIKQRDFYPNKTVNVNDTNDSFMNSAPHTNSNYSHNNYLKPNNYGSDKISNIIIPKKVLSDYPITYEEVKARMSFYYNKKFLHKQKIQGGNCENKPNEYETMQRDAIAVKKNDQVSNYNINSHVFEEKIKKKLSNNLAKNPVVEQFNNNNNNFFNNPGLKKANDHFGAFNPNNIIINSNNNYNNINLNIINKDRSNEADKNLISKIKPKPLTLVELEGLMKDTFKKVKEKFINYERTKENNKNLNFPHSLEKIIIDQLQLLQEFRDIAKNSDYNSKRLTKLLKIFLNYIVSMLDIISKSKFVKELEKHVIPIVIKINIFSHDISKSFKKKLNRNNDIANQQKDESIKNPPNKIALPNRIKTCKYLLHFITLILEIRSLNIESFDKASKTNSNADNNRKDSINEKSYDFCSTAEAYMKKNIDLIRITKKLKRINNEIKDKNDFANKRMIIDNKGVNNVNNSGTNNNLKKDFDVDNFNKINDSLNTNPNFITIRSSVKLLQGIINLYNTYIDSNENSG